MGVTHPKTTVIVRAATEVRRKRRFPFGLFALLLVLGAPAVFLFNWEQSHAAAIYPGVKIAGVDVGGLTVDQAKQRLVALNQTALNRVISVDAGAKHWSVTPHQLGLQLNLDDLLRQAYALGHESSVLDRYSTQLDLLLHGRQLALAGNYDTDRVQAFVRTLAIDLYQPAQPAVVSLQQDRAVLSTSARVGQMLDQPATTSLLTAALADPQQSRVTVPTETVQAPVSEAEGQREVAALQSILKTRLHLRFGQQHWLLGSGVIAPAISLTTVIASGGSATYKHSVNQQVLAQFVDSIGTQIDRPVRSATVVAHGASLSVVAALNGYHLDRTAAVQVLTQAILQGGTQTVDLPVAVAQAETPTAVAQQAAHQAAVLIQHPIMLTYGVRHWLLSSAQLGSLLTFTPRLDSLVGPQLDPHIDATKLPAVLGQATTEIATAPTDARFVVQGNRVALIPSKNGIRVDIAALAPLIAGHTRGAVIPIPTQSYAPALTTAKAQAMGINTMILSHSTYFPGSSDARLTNIHAAVQHLDGQLIAPGEVFSFNKRIGDITAQGGYVEGIDIIDNQDVPGIGGGVCQVAVTLFQSAIYSGMEILERVPHANIVSYYNPIGMDATVYVSPYGPDVKFRNNTGHWVLIDFVEDLKNDRLTARLFGTDPHFKVVIRGPFVTNQANGDVDAVFYRTVYDSTGKAILDAHFNSHYVPAGAIN